MSNEDSLQTGLDSRVRKSAVGCFVIPTELPEADGTYSWNKTTLVTVEVEAAGESGFGYTYADAPTAQMAGILLKECVDGQLTAEHPKLLFAMQRASRQAGLRGTAAMAISAIDMALWDLRAKLLGVPLVYLFGMAKDSVPVYGSGGFISYDESQLQEQLLDWKEQGIRMMKMKIRNDLKAERSRVSFARTVVGADTELFVDANGACTPKQALAFAQAFRDLNVSWFEEPVSSDDLSGMRFVREHAPAEMEIAAGEYGYTPHYFQRMLYQNAVDVLQADATRCLGISGFLQVGALADAWKVPLSSHCGPTAHLHPMLSLPAARHMEYFHTHVRVEKMLFDGFLSPEQGRLIPDLSRPGMGITFKHLDARRFAV